MTSLLLPFVLLFPRRDNAAPKKICIVLYHILDNTVESIVVVAVLYVYIKILYHFQHLVWSFHAQLIYQWKTFMVLFLLFTFLYFLFLIRTVYICRLFVWIWLNISDLNTLNLVVRWNYVTILNRFFFWIQCILRVFTLKNYVKFIQCIFLNCLKSLDPWFSIQFLILKLYCIQVICLPFSFYFHSFARYIFINFHF